jgi:thioesterase domain-containing protein
MPDRSADVRRASPPPDALARAAVLEREMRDTIPLARAMDMSIVAYDGASLTIAAPLAPNINDKGCAFGGSLASLMTLAGWALVRLAVDARTLSADIYVQDSAIRYLAPVRDDFRVVARHADGAPFDAFLDALAARGKARLRVHCEVAVRGGTAATLEAGFVALARR